MNCWECGGQVRVERMGLKWFGLCFGACAGAAKFGSPLTNGQNTEGEAQAELKHEARKAAARKEEERKRAAAL